MKTTERREYGRQREKKENAEKMKEAMREIEWEIERENGDKSEYKERKKEIPGERESGGRDRLRRWKQLKEENMDDE